MPWFAQNGVSNPSDYADVMASCYSFVGRPRLLSFNFVNRHDTSFKMIFDQFHTCYMLPLFVCCFRCCRSIAAFVYCQGAFIPSYISKGHYCIHTYIITFVLKFLQQCLFFCSGDKILILPICYDSPKSKHKELLPELIRRGTL